MKDADRYASTVALWVIAMELWAIASALETLVAK